MPWSLYPRYLLCIRLGGSQGRSERVRKVSLPTGIQSQDCPACSNFDEMLSKITGSLHEDLCTVHIWQDLAEFCLELEMFFVFFFHTNLSTNQNTHFKFSNVLFPPENRAVCEIVWKNMVQPVRPQMTWWRMRIACWMTGCRHALRMVKIYCFSTATMTMRKRLSVTLHAHCLSCLILKVWLCAVSAFITGESF